MFDLAGQTAVVTGGAGWLGRPMVEVLAGHGARVIIASRDAETAARVIGEMGEPGQRVAHVRYDQGDGESVRALCDEVMTRCGAPHVLVNNAAAWPMRDRAAPVEDFARSMQINATGLFALTRAMGEAMAAAGRGSIINVGSSFGMVGPDFSIYEGLTPAGGLPDYFFHKGGMLQLTRYMAALHGRQGVRVNTLSVGPVRKKQSDALAARFSARTLLGRMGRPQDVQGAVLFLASAASGFMTGANLVVDGGYTAM